MLSVLTTCAELLLGAHLQEPQAREERREEGDDDDADDAHSDAAVVAHAVRRLIETRRTLVGTVAGPGRARSSVRVSASTRRRAPGRRVPSTRLTRKNTNGARSASYTAASEIVDDAVRALDRVDADEHPEADEQQAAREPADRAEERRQPAR